MAAKTTAKLSVEPGTFACRAIWSATLLCGRPAPEKIGSFWPRTRVLVPSIVEIPVWMKSAGVRVDRSPGDIEALLRHDLRAAVDGLAATGQDTAKHLPADGHLDGLTG